MMSEMQERNQRPNRAHGQKGQKKNNNTSRSRRGKNREKMMEGIKDQSSHLAAQLAESKDAPIEKGTKFLNPLLIQEADVGFRSYDTEWVVTRGGSTYKGHFWNLDGSIVSQQGLYIYVDQGTPDLSYPEQYKSLARNCYVETAARELKAVHTGFAFRSRYLGMLRSSKIPYYFGIEEDITEWSQDLDTYKFCVGPTALARRDARVAQQSLLSAGKPDFKALWWILFVVPIFFFDPLLGLTSLSSFMFVWYRKNSAQLYEWWWNGANEVEVGPLSFLYYQAKKTRDCCDGRGVDGPLHIGVSYSIDLPMECPHHEKYDFGSYGVVIRGVPLVVPRPCAHNLAQAAYTRILKERPFCVRSVKKFVAWVKKRIVNDIPPMLEVVEPSITEYVRGKAYGGQRKKRMLEVAGLSLLPEDWRENPFIKDEAYLGKTVDSYKTRLIVGRTDELVAKWGPFFDVISETISRIFGGEATCIYDKKCTPTELGQYAEKHFSLGRQVFEIDASNWDGSLLVELIEFENWLMEKVFNWVGAILPPELKKVWTRTTFNSEAVRFTYRHGRRSGDLWTSCFNSLLNIYLAKYIFGEDVQGVFRGDDNWVAVSGRPKLHEIVKKYADLGFTAKVIPRSDIRNLGFCSGKFYPATLDGSYVWGVNPGRVLAKLGLDLKNIPTNKRANVLLGTAISLGPIAQHVPLISEVVLSIEEQLGRGGLGLRPDFRAWNTWQHNAKTRYALMDEAIDYYCQLHDITRAEYQSLTQRLTGIDWSRGGVVIDDPLLTQIVCNDIGCDPTIDDGWSDPPSEVSELRLPDFVTPVVVEELLRSFSPLGMLCLIGLFEPWFNFFVHVWLTILTNFTFLGKILVPVYHLTHNYQAICRETRSKIIRSQNNLNENDGTIMATRGFQRWLPSLRTRWQVVSVLLGVTLAVWWGDRLVLRLAPTLVPGFPNLLDLVITPLLRTPLFGVLRTVFPPFQ